MKAFKLYESEYRLMDLIWRKEPLKSTELVRQAFEELGWKKSTCYTVLKKLETKGFVQNEKAVVTSLVVREQVQRYESETLLARNFGGSLPAFFNAFLTGRKLTRQEAEEIYRLIENAVAENEKESGRKDGRPEGADERRTCDE